MVINGMNEISVYIQSERFVSNNMQAATGRLYSNVGTKRLKAMNTSVFIKTVRFLVKY